MTTTISPVGPDEMIRRKVTASGVIWLNGRSYYVSRRLSGQTIPIRVADGRLVVDAMIPLRKEYRLPGPAAAVAGKVRGLRSARRAS